MDSWRNTVGEPLVGADSTTQALENVRRGIIKVGPEDALTGDEEKRLAPARRAGGLSGLQNRQVLLPKQQASLMNKGPR